MDRLLFLGAFAITENSNNEADSNKRDSTNDTDDNP